MTRWWIIVPAVAVAGFAACSDEGSDDPMSQETIPATVEPTTAVDDLLCGFVPPDSVALALGTDRFDAAGDVFRDPDATNEVSTATCTIATADYDDPDGALRVRVDFAMGSALDDLERRLTAVGTRVSEELGVGASWTDDGEPRVEGSSGRRGHTVIGRGNWVIHVDITVSPDGRDPAADATALAAQVIQTLPLGDEWTIRGEPPEVLANRS